MGGAVAGAGVLGDRYEVRESLGAGPLGEVHRAVDLRLGRDVAVKVVHGRLADQPGLREHLDRAVRAAAAVDHPGLAAVLDLDVAARPPWLVSALVRGRNLRQVLRDDGPLDPRTAAALTAELCAALAAAHAAGVVHGGLRPGNILLRDGGGVIVTDLGLDAVSGVASAQYLAPEQVLGEEGGVPADLYALGCCLHAMLTGRPPFTGAPRAVLAQHAEASPPAPSAARPGIPLALDRAVLRLLAKRPDDRHPTALAVRAALLAVAEERGGRFPSPASRPGSPTPTPGRSAALSGTGTIAAPNAPGPRATGSDPAPAASAGEDGARAAAARAGPADAARAPSRAAAMAGGKPPPTDDPPRRADPDGAAAEATSSPRRRLVRGADLAAGPPADPCGGRSGPGGGGEAGAPRGGGCGRAPLTRLGARGDRALGRRPARLATPHGGGAASARAAARGGGGAPAPRRVRDRSGCAPPPSGAQRSRSSRWSSWSP